MNNIFIRINLFLLKHMDIINLPNNIRIIKIINGNETTLIVYWNHSKIKDLISTIETKKINSGYINPIMRLYSDGKIKNNSKKSISKINGLDLDIYKNHLLWNFQNPEIHVEERKYSYNNSKLYLNKKCEEWFMINDLQGDKRSLKIFNGMTVRHIKEIIHEIDRISLDNIRLIFGGKQLCDDDTIEKCGIIDGCMVHMVLRLRGGMYHKTSGKSGNYQQLENNKIIAINDDLKLMEILKNFNLEF